MKASSAGLPLNTLIALLCVLIGATLVWVLTPKSPLSLARFKSLHASLRQKIDPREVSFGGDAQKTYARATAILEEGNDANYASAIAALEKLFVSHPRNADYLGTLLWAYSKNRVQDAASLKTLKELVETYTQTYAQKKQGWDALFRILIKAGETGAAEMPLKRLREFSKGGEKTIYEAILMYENKKFSDAIGISDAILRSAPRHVEAIEIKGKSLFELAVPDLAKIEFEKRLSLVPEDPLSFYYLGWIDEKGALFNSAKSWFQESLRVFPDDPSPRLHLADIYHYHDGEQSFAERHYRDLLTRYQRFLTDAMTLKIRRSLIETLLKLRKNEEAIRMILSNRFLDREPSAQQFDLIERLGFLPMYSDFPEHQYLKGLYLFDAQNWKEASGTLQSFLSRKPDHYHAKVYLTASLIKEGLIDKAAELSSGFVSDHEYFVEADYGSNVSERQPPIDWKRLDQVLRNEHKPLSSHTSTLLFLSSIKRHLGEYAKAEDLIQKAIRILPTIDPLWVHLAHLEYLKGRPGQAIPLLSKALKINPGNGFAKQLMGRIAEKKRSFQEARQWFHEASQTPALAHIALYALGEIELTQNNPSKARELWRQSLSKHPDYIPSWQALIRHAREAP